MSLQLGETLRRDQRHSILQRDRPGGIAFIKELDSSLRNYGNLTAEAAARFLEERAQGTPWGFDLLGISLVATKCAIPYQ